MDINIDIPQDLEPTDLDLLCDLLPEFFNPMTIGPRLKEINLDKSYHKDIILDKGFTVTQKPFKKKIKDKDGKVSSKGIKNIHGIHSPYFGSDWNDDNPFATRYSCECGEKIGKVYENTICPKCGTKVKLIDVDMKIFAWLKIKHPAFKLIHPQMYKKLDTFFGKKVLGNIISFKKFMTLDGEYQTIDVVDNKQPFYGIGMVEFCNRFDEILEYYAKKNKNKVKYDMYFDIKSKKDLIFTTSVPVFSAVLRQVFFSDEDYSYTELDKRYNSMFGNFSCLNEETEVNELNIAKVNENLYRAQMQLNRAYDIIFTSVTEKDGLIRRQILGGRINFSARTVNTLAA